MTATNHLLAGAVVATGLQRPFLIVPLALVTHFLLDAFPHFGIHEDDHSKRNKHPLFRFILVVDVLLSAALLVLLPFVLQGSVSWWVLTLGMVCAWIPDAIWIRHFIRQRRGKFALPHGWLSKFHQAIQWFEKPLGIVVEIICFAGLGVSLGLLAY